MKQQGITNLSKRIAMAKQVGPLLLEGSMNGINYYFLEGEALARRSGGGFTGEAIKKSPAMETVRKNDSEFGCCSKVNKQFKTALRPFLAGYQDGTLHRRLMQMFLKIKNSDLISEHGQRSVHQGISAKCGQQLLQEFIFTPKRTHFLGCNYQFNWDTRALEVSEFTIKEARFPKNSHFMEIVVGLIRFDFESLAYEQVHAAPTVIARDFEGDSFEVRCNEIPDGEGILFAMVRIGFYQKVDGDGHLVGPPHSFGIAVASVWDDGEGE